MQLHEMNAHQLASFYEKQRATAETLLVLIQNQVDPTNSRAGGISESLTKISGLGDRLDPSDMRRLSNMAGRMDVVTDPGQADYDLRVLVGDLRGQATHAALVEERKGVKGELKEVRSGCCINCIIGYIGSDGQRYDRTKSPISATASMGHC